MDFFTGPLTWQGVVLCGMFIAGIVAIVWLRERYEK